MTEIIASTYEVVQSIGTGGGGVVYLAYHKRLGKKVVLKADKRKLSTPPELLRREVDVLKTLRHSHIPQVYDFFVEGDTVYTVMDYIEGESLDRALEHGETFSQPQVIAWAIQLLDALAYLHSPTHGEPPRGFIHSDIKPANIMRMPDNNICLIDFNIALALGEENIIGWSAGYSSPEHYGLDFSTDGTTSIVARSGMPQRDQSTLFAPSDEVTVTAGIDTRSQGVNSGTATAEKIKTVTPDIRSDIYSTGATLYHLLCGKRPARNAKDVIPLSAEEFSPPVAEIINRAMDPNPDRRFQTAEEMLEAFVHLRETDPRVKRLKRDRIVSTALFAVCFGLGAAGSFVGLKRMQTTESWLKLAEYSKSALQSGDVAAATEYALQAFPTPKKLLTPTYIPQAQKALTNALGVYNLSDSFQSHGTIELPSAPLFIKLSPDGKTAACLYSGELALIDTTICQVMETLPVQSSALAEVEYLDNDDIVYAGRDGICLYDVTHRKMRWQGRPTTGIAISGNGKYVAAVYKEEPQAVIYDADTGAVQSTVDFAGKSQQVTFNDIFANPNDNLFELNEDGTILAASFSDGSLWLYDMTNGTAKNVLENNPGYTHFEGGFHKQYFAFSATNSSESVFVIIDTTDGRQTGGYRSQYPFSVQTDADGIYVETENILVGIDPETGAQTPLVTTSKSLFAFSKSDTHTLAVTTDSFDFYGPNAELTVSYEKTEDVDFVQMADDTALIGGRDSPTLRLLRYENHPEAELLTYDPAYPHDEARLSADGQTVMMFSYDKFRIYDKGGEVVLDTEIPDAQQVYDQQFRREGGESYLEVLYYDGTVCRYDAHTGEKIYQEAGKAPDPDLYEEFQTDTLRIESPLHGTPTAYDLKTGKKVADLESEAYLTYITQIKDYVVAQYITTDGYYYGELLDNKCNTLADLPYLCDIVDETLIFDYPTGNMRKSRIYYIDELIQQAKSQEERNETQ